MPQIVDQTFGRFTARRRTRSVLGLFASAAALLALVALTACAGVNDNGTDFGTLATMEARQNVPPPTSGSPVPGGDTEDPDQLAALGQQLYSTQGCIGCHTLDGTASVGPTWQGLWMSEITLTDGRTVTADEGYIQRAIWDPQVEVHEGFQPIMTSYRGVLDENQVAAIIEFIKTLE